MDTLIFLNQSQNLQFKDVLARWKFLIYLGLSIQSSKGAAKEKEW